MENEHDVNRGKDCMKTSCKYLREHAKEINSFKLILTGRQLKPYKNSKFCYICKDNLKINMLDIKNIVLHIAYIIESKVSLILVVFSYWMQICLSFYYRRVSRRI